MSVKSFKNFVNENIKDLLVGKSSEDIKNQLKGKSFSEILNLTKKYNIYFMDFFTKKELKDIFKDCSFKEIYDQIRFNGDIENIFTRDEIKELLKKDVLSSTTTYLHNYDLKLNNLFTKEEVRELLKKNKWYDVFKFLKDNDKSYKEYLSKNDIIELAENRFGKKIHNIFDLINIMFYNGNINIFDIFTKEEIKKELDKIYFYYHNDIIKMYKLPFDLVYPTKEQLIDLIQRFYYEEKNISRNQINNYLNQFNIDLDNPKYLNISKLEKDVQKNRNEVK